MNISKAVIDRDLTNIGKFYNRDVWVKVMPLLMISGSSWELCTEPLLDQILEDMDENSARATTS